MSTTRAYTEVLVGTDGSATAQSAVRAAGAVARALQVPVTVVTGWYRDHVDDYEALETSGSSESAGARNSAWATDVVVDAAAALRAAGTDEVKTATPEGGPAEVLLRLGDDRPGALVVVGTVGLDRTAERLLGNIPHQLTHHAHSDLLLVARGRDEDDVTWDSVALATDGSPTAALAVAHGAELAAALGAKTTLLTVATSEDRGQRTLDATGVETDDSRIEVGRDVAKALASAGRDHDLLVLGNKGMSGASRLLGSVANSVTHDLPTDLLLVNTTR
jgi:nucleotide-binding universal stress UspA family protein